MLLLSACSESEVTQDAGSAPVLPDFGIVGFDSADEADGNDEADGANGAEGTDQWSGTDGTDGVEGTDETDQSDGAEPQLCCTTDADCPPERNLCAPVTGTPPEGEDVTAKGMCQQPLDFPGCVRHADCGPFGECVGLLGCACDDVFCEGQFGLCEVSVPEECCEDFTGCAPGEVCVQKGQYGQCLALSALKPGRCFTDETCPEGQQCIGTTTCDCAEEDCTVVQGTCVIPGLSECQSNDDCNGGSCMATEPCAADCPPGDPTCCYGNTCIFQTPECTTDEHCSTGPCIAGGTCYPWCPVGDPSCCFGNTCFEDPCAGANPQGCYFTGCGPGKICKSNDQCIPTSCECAADGWVCTGDCLGGSCVESACVGKNPQGCSVNGCPEGYACLQETDCTPTSCTCNTQLGAWECTSDCGGGMCVKL